MSTTKVTVNLPNATVDALRDLAKSRGTTLTEALRQAIESQRFLNTEVESGNRLLIQNPVDQTVRQLVFNTPIKPK